MIQKTIFVIAANKPRPQKFIIKNHKKILTALPIHIYGLSKLN